MTDELLYLIVQKDTSLTDVDGLIPVVSVADGMRFDIKCDKLLVHKGQIFTVPSQLYKLDEAVISFSEVVDNTFESVDSGTSGFDDNDLALLLDVEVSPDPIERKRSSDSASEDLENRDFRISN